MVKYQIVLLFVVTLVSCKKENGVTINATKENTTALKKDSEMKSFFTFDKVEYYYKHIQEDVFLNYKKPEFKDKQSDLYKYMQIVEGYYPEKLHQENFINDLLDFGYKKMNINSTDFSVLNTVFSEAKCDDGYAMACVPIYRDILILYNNDKIVGIAKICFGCRQSYIIGTDKDDSEFGQCGGFENLEAMLSIYKKSLQ